MRTPKLGEIGGESRQCDYSINFAYKMTKYSCSVCSEKTQSDSLYCEVSDIYFILFYFILFYFILFYFILFYFILFYFILFYFISFHFISFHFILFYFILFYFILFYFIYKPCKKIRKNHWKPFYVYTFKSRKFGFDMP